MAVKPKPTAGLLLGRTTVRWSRIASKGDGFERRSDEKGGNGEDG